MDFVFYARNESNPLCSRGWEKHQRRRPQTWSWIRVGGMRGGNLAQQSGTAAAESDLNSTVGKELKQSPGNPLSPSLWSQ